MGWAWALFFANESVFRMVTTAAGGHPRQMLRERHPPPRFSPESPVTGVYVDNVMLLAFDRLQALQHSCAIDDEAKKIDLSLPIDWTHEEPVLVLECAGVVVHFGEKRVRNKSSRTWRFYLATSALLRRPAARGEHLEVWAGHAASLFSICRPAYSIMSAVYTASSRKVEGDVCRFGSRCEPNCASPEVWSGCSRATLAPTSCRRSSVMTRQLMDMRCMSPVLRGLSLTTLGVGARGGASARR